jgi:hypothetical protein
MVHLSARSRPTWGALQLVLSQCWWAGRLAVWLCGLPARLRRLCRPLPRDHAVRLVIWVCHRRVFRRPLFLRACLRQALALYYVLTRLGYPVEIHFGIQKKGKTLHGHSWVTVQDELVAERARPDVFTIMYSYPSVVARSPRQEMASSDGAGGARRS